MPDEIKIEGPPDPHALYTAITERVAALHPSRVVLGEGADAVILAETQITRKCGECSLCCTVAGVAELEKPPFTRCQHLAAGGHGCSIYATRPGACKGFVCAWLAGNFDTRFRPDKIGAYAAFFMTGEHGVYAVIQVDSRLVNQRRLRQMVRRLQRALPEIRLIIDDDHGFIFRHGQKPLRIKMMRRPKGDFETAVYMYEEQR